MIPDREWVTYLRAIRGLRQKRIPFMLGGGFAQAVFTGRLRNTKDVDLYIDPGARDATVEVLSSAGFEDYFQQQSYVRNWIYRSHQSGVIVDVIWSMANQRAQVDSLWFERAGSVRLRGEKLAVVPVEEFMWCKLYIMQRDHCDWTDLLNVMYTCGRRLDWEHLIWRVGEDLPLLKAMLLVYGWLGAPEAHNLPASVWRRLELPESAPASAGAFRERVRLLDSRCWFAGLRKPGEMLEV
jgi:hypothetical protein